MHNIFTFLASQQQAAETIMWLLLLTFLMSTLIILEQLFMWLRYSLKKERFPLHDCFAALYKQQKTNALIFCQQLDTPALKMLQQGINALSLFLLKKK